MFLSVSVSSGLFLAIYALLIPIVIRFGAEKGRYAYISFFLIGFVLLLAIVKIVPLTELTMFLKQNAIAIEASFLVLLILIVGISYQVSLHYYSKKEF